MRLVIGAVMLLVMTPSSRQQVPTGRPTTAPKVARMVLVARKCIPIGARMDGQHILSAFKREQVYFSVEDTPEYCISNFMQLKDKVARVHVQQGMFATFTQFVDDEFWGHNGPDERAQIAFEREQFIRRLDESCSRCGIRRLRPVKAK